MVTNKKVVDVGDSLAMVDNAIDEGRYDEAIRVAIETAKACAPVELMLRYLEMASELQLLETANRVCDQWPRSSIAAYFSGRLLSKQRSDAAALQRLNQAIDLADGDPHMQIMMRYHRSRSALRLGEMNLFIADLSWVGKACNNDTPIFNRTDVLRYFAVAISETEYKFGLAKRFEDAALVSPIKDHFPHIAKLLCVKADEFRLMEALSAATGAVQT
jgi:hypothetical protein